MKCKHVAAVLEHNDDDDFGRENEKEDEGAAQRENLYER